MVTVCSKRFNRNYSKKYKQNIYNCTLTQFAYSLTTHGKLDIIGQLSNIDCLTKSSVLYHYCTVPVSSALRIFRLLNNEAQSV